MADTLPTLPPELILSILSYIPARDLLTCRRVNHSFSILSSHDSLWSPLCRSDWGLDPLSRHLGPIQSHLPPSHKIESFPSVLKGSPPVLSWIYVWMAWNRDFGRYRSIIARAVRCIASLRSWLRANCPMVHQTLGISGVSEKELDEAEKEIKRKIPDTTRVIYRLLNGQRTISQLVGLFGGYSFYNLTMTLWFLPLHIAVQSTIKFDHPNSLVFSSSNSQILFVDTKNDSIVASNPHHNVIQASPLDSDGLLGWLEEYTNRLVSGYYIAGQINPDYEHKGILLYPQKVPQKSEVVTRGIRVEASAVLAPETCEGSLGFTYSIRISGTDAMTESCQLTRRHWIINDGGKISHVEGEGVIGLYPVISKNMSGVFAYQSCTNMTSSHGSMRGILHPTGPPFKVEVGEFAIEEPDWVF